MFEKTFFQTLLGFLKADYTKRNYTSGIYVSNTISSRIHLICDFFYGSIVNGNRPPNLYSEALDKPPGQKVRKKFGKKLHKKINGPIWKVFWFM